LPPLVLADITASVALDGTAMLYRLSYADSQQLKPYALARWSMPPAQLIRQRLREYLGQHRSVLNPGDLLIATPARAAASAPQVKPTSTLTLRLELDEFSQLFDTPDKSTGLLRLSATLTQRTAGVESLLGQRSFVVQQAAPAPDASGGVRALTAATDQAVQEVNTWLTQLSSETARP
jgi:cholesterol transport system auxiliary component